MIVGQGEWVHMTNDFLMVVAYSYIVLGVFDGDASIYSEEKKYFLLE